MTFQAVIWDGWVSSSFTLAPSSVWQSSNVRSNDSWLQTPTIGTQVCAALSGSGRGTWGQTVMPREPGGMGKALSPAKLPPVLLLTPTSGTLSGEASLSSHCKDQHPTKKVVYGCPEVFCLWGTGVILTVTGREDAKFPLPLEVAEGGDWE